MKTIITILLLTPLFIKAQTINDIPLDSLDLNYIALDITAGAKFFKISVKLDVGQRNVIFNGKELWVKDEDGKVMNFNSVVDALNFFYEYDYRLVQAYSYGSTNTNYYYLMEKINKK